MANNNVGECDCPICKKVAFVRLTKKSKHYIICDDCGFQGFARGFTANDTLKNTMRPLSNEPEKVTPAARKVVEKATPVVIQNKVIPEKIPVLVDELKTPPAEVVKKPDLTIFDHEFWTKGKNNANA
jgi:hypothetical protein